MTGRDTPQNTIKRFPIRCLDHCGGGDGCGRQLGILISREGCEDEENWSLASTGPAGGTAVCAGAGGESQSMGGAGGKSLFLLGRTGLHLGREGPPSGGGGKKVGERPRSITK